MGGKGLEPVGATTLSVNELGKSEKSRAAESGAFSARTVIDVDLAVLVAAWPALPAEVRGEISRMVRSGMKVKM